MLTRDLLYQASRRLARAGCDSPRLDAELLLMHCWKLNRLQLIGHGNQPVPPEVCEAFLRLLERRQRREPVAHILGEREFWSRSFRVGPDVLIPRPETEHLIEAVLARFPDRNQPWRFCDIGTGSGCIAVTLACEYPQAHIVASDISDASLRIAQTNAQRHDVARRIGFIRGDMLTPFAPAGGRFDAVVSNPPYVALAEMHSLVEELAFEPRHALTDEADGLRFLQQILVNSAGLLRPGGFVIVETGTCGLPATPAELRLEQTISDLAGHLRGAIYRRSR